MTHQFYDPDTGWCVIEPKYAKRRLFKKDAAPAPKPDPLIGQAAQGNVQLGRESLAFARQQYEEGKIRQADLDALTKRVAESALGSQELSERWAQEDRAISNQLREKYEGWADQDRQLGRDTANYADSLATQGEALGEKYENRYLAEADRQKAFSAEEIDRYKSGFRPIQDRLAQDAMNWDSAERLESEAGKARAEVLGNADLQRQAQQRQMASMGVNPNSGRFAGVERATDTMTALGAAGAQNAARDNIRAQGIQLRGEAANMGQQVLSNGQNAGQLGMAATGAANQAKLAGLGTAMQAKNLGLAAAGVGNTSAGLSMGNQGAGYTGIGAGLSAGNSAVGAMQSGTQGWMQNGGIMQGGFNSAMQGNASGAGIANSLYGNQLNAWNGQNQANAAKWSAIGQTVGTVGSMFLM